MRSLRLPVTSLLGFALLASACGHRDESSAPTATAPSAPAAPNPALTGGGCGDAASARDVVEDPSFELRASPRAGYTTGAESRFDITLVARGNYHVNTQYPLSVRLNAPPPVRLARNELGVEQASEFGEPRAKFEVPFTATSVGEQRVTAEVDFAVCTPESCMPDCRTIALMLPIGAGAGEGPQ